jgi:hypothetical protein
MSIPLESPQPIEVVEDTVDAPRRHALGLPAGSVRALLALSVLALLWTIVLRYDFGEEPLSKATLPMPFVYLQFLMILILAHFFASHGKSIGPAVSTRSPLALPRGSIRFVLLAGYLGLAAFLYHEQPDLDFPTKGQFILLTGLLTSGFFLGHVLSGVVRIFDRGNLPDWFLDFEAWIALLAVFGLGVLLMVHVIINPGLPDSVKLELPTWEAGLAGVVGFYFGARS